MISNSLVTDFLFALDSLLLHLRRPRRRGRPPACAHFRAEAAAKIPYRPSQHHRKNWRRLRAQSICRCKLWRRRRLRLPPCAGFLSKTRTWSRSRLHHPNQSPVAPRHHSLIAPSSAARCSWPSQCGRSTCRRSRHLKSSTASAGSPISRRSCRCAGATRIRWPRSRPSRRLGATAPPRPRLAVSSPTEETRQIGATALPRPV